MSCPVSICWNSTWMWGHFLIYNFIYLYLFFTILALCCCAGFSLAASGGSSLIQCMGFSLVASHCRAWALGTRASVAAALGLSNCDSKAPGPIVVTHGLSWSTACGIFPDQGWNLCLLYWQADFLPQCHQGSPWMWVLHTDPSAFVYDCTSRQQSEFFLFLFNHVVWLAGS